MLVTVVLGGLLIAHGLVHLLYLVRSQDPNYPMTAGKSWLVTRAGVSLKLVSPLVAVLAVVSVVGFVLMALSYWGLLVPATWLQGLAIVSVTASLLLTALTWNIQFIFSVAINLAILYWALVWQTR